MSIGRLLRACGFEETPGTAPVTHEHASSDTVPGTSIAMDVTGKYPVITAILPNASEVAQAMGMSAAYLLADALDRDIAEARARGLLDAGVRIGADVFGDDIVDQLEAAGVRIEASADGGIILHMPHTGVEIAETSQLAQTLSAGRLGHEDLAFPRMPPAADPHSYLQHDLTKQHQNARRRRRKGRK